EFAAERGRHLLFACPTSGERAVAAMQAVLSLPCDVFHLGADRRLALAQRGTDGRAMAVRPSGFDDDTTQMRIARFGDTAASGPRATRILARYGAAVSHQLSWLRKSGELAHLGGDRHGRNQRDPAECLQRVDYRPHTRRRGLD